MQNKLEKNYIQSICDVVASEKSPLTTRMVLKISNSFSVKYNVPIPYEDLKDTQQKRSNKRTYLFENIMKFNPQQQREILEYIMNLECLSSSETVQNKRAEYYERFGFLKHESLNQDSDELSKKLSKYPAAFKQYKSALEGIKKHENLRHIADDLRLCLELFLRAVFNNDKSLENQKSLLKPYFSDKKAKKKLILLLLVFTIIIVFKTTKLNMEIHSFQAI